METAISFLALKDPQKKTKTNRITPIYLIIKIGEIRLKYSTGEKIAPANWDQKTGQVEVKGTNAQRDKFKTINTQLNRYKDNFERSLANLKTLKKTPTLEYFRHELEKEFKKNPQSNPKQPSFFKFIDEWISSCDRAANTKKHYTTTQNLLDEFQTFRKKKIRYESIDLNFYDEFVNYMQVEKKFTVNTIGTQIKNLKVFMNESLERKFHENHEHLNKKFKTTEEETDSIYLTEKELNLIYNKDISDNKKLDRVRDTFIIGCRTGLRFSDLRQIAPENIVTDEEGNKFLKITTQKTDERVIIPLHWMVLEILAKYENNLPRVISNQKFNEYLKDLGKLVEIKDSVQLTKTKEGMRYTKTFIKHELITVHTARRTFATLAYLADIPAISIMKITGHRTERAFLKYIKMSQEDNAKKLSQHPFFTSMRIAK